MTHTQRYTVDEESTIGFMGEGLRVYATPFMVRDIESACGDLVRPCTFDAENS